VEFLALTELAEQDSLVVGMRVAGLGLLVIKRKGKRRDTVLKHNVFALLMLYTYSQSINN